MANIGFTLKDLLAKADKTQGAKIVPIVKPPSLDKLATQVSLSRNGLVSIEAKMEQFELIYAENKASLLADLEAAKQQLREDLAAFYAAAKGYGIPVGTPPDRA